MCLIAFAIGVSKRWPMVIASNRDEFLNRPTLPLARWQTDGGQPIISGRDLRAGGTWLGLTPNGRVAFLTNVREANAQTGRFSRGELVTRWLEAHADAESFVASLAQDAGAYGGFNLVLGDIERNSWSWVTNKSTAAAPAWKAQVLQPGVYGLSNAALDTPWPKTVALKAALAACLARQENHPDINVLQEAVWTALMNDERVQAARLPVTGVSEAVEYALSSMFVSFPERGYGTRCSTLVLASREPTLKKPGRWQIRMEERTHSHEKPEEGTGSASFNSSVQTFFMKSDFQ